MAVTVIATPADPTANSFITRAFFNTYWGNRLHSAKQLAAADDNKDRAVIMATRVLRMALSPGKTLVRPTSGVNARDAYFITRATWTGLPTTTTQALPWPRTGMFDSNGNAIGSMVIPIELQEATAELAGQLLLGDRTLDNNIAVKGITDLKAGPVELSFKDNDGAILTTKMLPDAVVYLLVPSWLTDETIESTNISEFDVIAEDNEPCRRYT